MTTTLTTETTQTTTEPADLWVIELNLMHLKDKKTGSEWLPVLEGWFYRGRNSLLSMIPRPLVECSEKSVEMRAKWKTYEEGSMRLRNVESDEVIPFEIFT